MGKVKNKRFKTQLHNPTGIVHNEDLGPCIVEEETHTSVVKNLIEQVQSTRPEDKECACTTIANLVGQPNSVSMFLKANVVKVLGPLLLDEKLSVRKLALGALRNITVAGNYFAVCEEMVKQDIMTPLVALLQQIAGEVQTDTFLNVPDNVEVFTQAVHVLWNICENSEIGVKIFNQQSLYQVLLLVLKMAVPLPSTVQLPIFQCLSTVSENNRVLCQALFQEMTMFRNLVSSNHSNTEELLIRVSCLGILQNILCCINDIPENARIEINTTTIVIISEVLLIEVKEMLQQALLTLEKLKTADIDPCVVTLVESTLQTENETESDSTTNKPAEIDMKEDAVTNGQSDNEENSRKQTDCDIKQKPSAKVMISLMDQQAAVEKQLKEVENVIQAQQIAIEIITNMCYSEEDDEWEDVDSSDGSMDELSMETDVSSPEYNIVKEPLLSKDIEQSFISQGITVCVLSKCQGIVDKELLTALSSHKLAHPIVKSLKQLQCYSLLCLANLVSTLKNAASGGGDKAALGGEDSTLLETMWKKLGILFTACSGVDQRVTEVELLEAVTTALRSVLQRLGEVQPSLINQVTEEDLKYLCDVELSCEQPEIRAHLIRIVGCIGCALAKQSQPHVYLKGIGIFFYEVCSRENELWVIAECLDCIFDVFGEDHLNDIIKQIQLLEKLQMMVPHLKAKVQEQKINLGEHRIIVNTAKNNLTRFIKYKKALIK